MYILSQHCFNRHGSFLVIEEYDRREWRGSILVPEGRQGKGWDGFISELRIAINFYQPLLAVNTVAKKRRSFSEVLSSSIHQTEDVFADSLEPLARIPKWLAASKINSAPISQV
jgi:hypothetical protein